MGCLLPQVAGQHQVRVALRVAASPEVVISPDNSPARRLVSCSRAGKYLKAAAMSRVRPSRAGYKATVPPHAGYRPAVRCLKSQLAVDAATARMAAQ